MKRFLLAFFLFFFFPICVSAQELTSDRQTALGVSPAIIEEILEPGKSATAEVTLHNFTAFPIPVKTLKESFTPKEKVEIPKNQLAIFDSSSWISLNDKDTDLILQPKESRVIKVIINQPPNAAPGGHYASLVFQPLIPQQFISKESIYVFARVAVLLFMQVKGDVNEQLEIQKLHLSSTYEHLPATISVPLKNTGNTHLRPSGRIELTDIKGKKVLSQSFIPSIILPGTTKEFPVELNKTKLQMGNYSLKVYVIYGTESTLLPSETYQFIIFPYQTSLFAGIPLIFGLIFIYKLRRRLYKAYFILRYGEKGLRKLHQKELDTIQIKRLTIRK